MLQNAGFSAQVYYIGGCAKNFRLVSSLLPEAQRDNLNSGHYSFGLGSVDLFLHPDPGPGQVQKTQETMCIFVVAGSHAAPVLEPADAPFHGVARLVPFRGVGLGFRRRPRAGMTA